MSRQILLITDPSKIEAADQIKAQLKSVGHLKLVDALSDELMDYVECSELIVVDATYVKPVEQVIAGIRKQVPNSRIVVISASPTWQRARSVFEAGAADFLSKNMPKEEFCAALASVAGNRRIL